MIEYSLNNVDILHEDYRIISSDGATGIEYEIVIYYLISKYLNIHVPEITDLINQRHDSKKIWKLIQEYDISNLLKAVRSDNLIIHGLCMTSNDNDIGPSDILLYVSKGDKKIFRLGLSIKYKGGCCEFNPSPNMFLFKEQKELLWKLYKEKYIPMFIEEMNEKYGHISNWYRPVKNNGETKRICSDTSPKFIDNVRNCVISNWNNNDITISKKRKIIEKMYHVKPEVDFWLMKYDNNGGFIIDKNPITCYTSRVKDIVLKKWERSFIGFFLDNKMIGKLSVKFESGFFGRCKNNNPDLVIDNVGVKYGKPFCSWNYNHINDNKEYDLSLMSDVISKDDVIDEKLIYGPLF